MRIALCIASVALVICSLGVGLQAGGADDPLPGSIKLLDGFKHQKMQGIDSRVGKIWIENGLSIQYDIGAMAGNYAKQQREYQADQMLWAKQQTIKGAKVEVVLRKDRDLYVSFPDKNANFFGKVKTEEELAEALLIVLSYLPAEKAGK